jgi:hypothetical protein
MSKKTMIVYCVIGLIVSVVAFVAIDNAAVACLISLVLLLSWARCE